MSLLAVQDVSLKGIELTFPELPVIGQPVGGQLQGGGLQSAIADPAGLDGGHETGALQDPEVLEKGGKGNGMRRRQAGHRPLSLTEGAEDRAADRVGQGDEGIVQPSMVNHKDKY